MATSDTVINELRRDVLIGTFSPGERLIELELSDRYSCGRALIREALVQLESEGLVDRQVNRGAVVHRVSIAEAIEITETRAALESFIATRAVLHATEEDIAELDAIVVQMRDAVESDDGPAYSDLNRQLHERLHEISGHSVATDLVRNLRDRGVLNQYRLAMMPGRQATSLEQHVAIVEAIRAKDEGAAAAAMSDHLNSVIEVLGRWGDAD